MGLRTRRTALVLAALVAASAVACGEVKTPVSRPIPRDYPGQLKKFQGKDLNNIGDMRENSIKGPQHVDIVTYRLKLFGLVDRPQTWTYREVISKHESVSEYQVLDCVEGWGVALAWEGVPMKDMLDEAGVKPEANTVILRAVDGYSTSFPLAYFDDRQVALAYRMNGITIPPERGYPFMLVAKGKWGYKWIKWVTSIEVSSNRDFKGYWERRGYSNSGDRDKSFFAP